ncbi:MULTISPECIES: protein YgfX [unclassified Shewanella]|uniref:protein YgfX n=1 Tax=unclassified Shewanella TaxID=196818 RepID=UPI002DD6A76C|nr:protein YgfX [Shewanella sp. D64]
MEEKQHSFSLISSFDQRFSLVVLACLCLTSFLAWPPFDNLFYHLTQVIFFSFMLLFFTAQFWKLNCWKCQFILNVAGEGSLAGVEKFTLYKRAFVSPFICLFYIETEKGLSLLMVWADMCDDISYRHLCRLLLTKKP